MRRHKQTLILQLAAVGIMLVVFGIVSCMDNTDAQVETDYEVRKEPVVYSHKIPSVDAHTLGALVGTDVEADAEFYANVTAYNSTREQCGRNPYVMASGVGVSEKYMACPRWVPFGTKVKLKDGMWRECQDVMSEKYPHRFDVFFWSKAEAQNWGNQRLKLKLYYE